MQAGNLKQDLARIHFYAPIMAEAAAKWVLENTNSRMRRELVDELASLSNMFEVNDYCGCAGAEGEEREEMCLVSRRNKKFYFDKANTRYYWRTATYRNRKKVYSEIYEWEDLKKIA